MTDIGVDSLAIPPRLPSFICRTSNVSARLPVAVFILAFRKSMPMPRSGCILSSAAHLTTYVSVSRSNVAAYVSANTIGIPPIKPCRRRRHFSPQTRVNRFVFLNRPILSLEDHLGVTASPQSPLPAGYVTLPGDSRSPPLGLTPPCSRRRAS